MKHIIGIALVALLGCGGGSDVADVGKDDSFKADEPDLCIPPEDIGQDLQTSPDTGPSEPDGMDDICVPGDTGCEASEEFCNGIDDDCDGDTDEGCGECRDTVCASVLCTQDCDEPDCLLDCCDGSCNLCHDGSLCIQGSCCMPECCGKQCGSDGCGGWCGQCPKWQKCIDGKCEVFNECGIWEGKVGCDGCSCQQCVCDMDPYCCDHPWDDWCVRECKNDCGGCLTCAPQCTCKECGPDGCGGSCGKCPPGKDCQNGKCEPCKPDCTGKACGDDGCGGSCGTCGIIEIEEATTFEIQICVDHECVCGRCDYFWGSISKCGNGGCLSRICVPDCTGRDCGDDGCGATCGICGSGAVCIDGTCDCDLSVNP